MWYNDGELQKEGPDGEERAPLHQGTFLNESIHGITELIHYIEDLISDEPIDFSAHGAYEHINDTKESIDALAEGPYSRSPWYSILFFSGGPGAEEFIDDHADTLDERFIIALLDDIFFLSISGSGDDSGTQGRGADFDAIQAVRRSRR